MLQPWTLSSVSHRLHKVLFLLRPLERYFYCHLSLPLRIDSRVSFDRGGVRKLCQQLCQSMILLQTWKVASQQCESYGWEESFTGCELGAGGLRAIERAVIVVISDLLTVCVAKSQSAELLLPVNWCLFTLLICAISIVSCYLCYVFSSTFVNRPSFSIILRVGLFTPYTHRKTFVTILTVVSYLLKTPDIELPHLRIFFSVSCLNITC
ncbi:hypothetical protein AVEN_159951-1 [Araneus ventricosus]|uniref:Uncharacterized protein n=1 Tax=Araneus ventricosus TaxID=182803 RepID=A0A4Y2I269_ARAVE|nr:hypothetical protein AVEN_159951-1 [Araneus ventricosus]